MDQSILSCSTGFIIIADLSALRTFEKVVDRAQSFIWKLWKTRYTSVEWQPGKKGQILSVHSERSGMCGIHSLTTTMVLVYNDAVEIRN
jgi:hypothetical protein